MSRWIRRAVLVGSLLFLSFCQEESSSSSSAKIFFQGIILSSFPSGKLSYKLYAHKGYFFEESQKFLLEGIYLVHLQEKKEILRLFAQKAEGEEKKGIIHIQ